MTDKNTKIVKEQKYMQEHMSEFHNDIQNYQNQHHKYINNIIKAADEKNIYNNKIYTSQQIVKSIDKINDKNSKIKEQTEKAVISANKHLKKSVCDFRQSKSTDLVNKIVFTENEINKLKIELKRQYSFINKDSEHYKDASIADMSKVKELYTNTLAGWRKYFKNTNQNFDQIDGIWKEMERSTVTMFDWKRFETDLDRRNKAYEELDNVKLKYMEFRILLSEIRKDEELKSSYEVRLYCF